ncbi:amidohydrolase family protein [Escherichia coli]|nr:amidohydrolase family protein [Escherichia coli]MCM4961208.1 amidohydrolase family protein [Escherichia coli]MCM4982962.1 amidohydrolase family protein [Escherichia coli]
MIINNVKLVLENEVVHGSLEVQDGEIRAFAESQSRLHLRCELPHHTTLPLFEKLAQLGLLDILSSDYYPASLLDAAFRVADDQSNRFTLPQAVRLVTKNPAQALNLQDRGVIGEGNRADLVLAHRKGNHIHIDHVWRQGKRVF